MKVGIGIIGCSYRILTLLREMLRADGNIEVRGLRDPDGEAVKRFLAVAPGAKVYESDRALAEAPDIDWVVVGSWNSLHAEQVITALQASKHVFCEKPLATTFADCLAIKEAYLASGRKMLVGFCLRYSSQYRKIKELVAGNAIGKVVSLEFNGTLKFNHGGYVMCGWRRQREFTGSHILEKCCHDFDLVNWIVESRPRRVASFGGLDFFTPEYEHRMNDLEPNEAGDKAYVAWASARGKNPFTSEKDIIDNQVCIMEYESGVRATFHTNLNAGIPERRMYILGTEGAIRADLYQGPIELRRIGFNETSQFFEGGNLGEHGGGDSVLIRHWLKMIREDAPSLTDLDAGIESAVPCLALDEAMLTGGIIDLSDRWAQLDSLALTAAAPIA